MKKLIRIRYVVCMSILFSILSVYGMEKDYTQLVSQEGYNNNNCLLIKLPNEKLIDIFSYCLVQDEDQVTSVKESIKFFMNLSTICKKFNRFLIFGTMGYLCRNFTQDVKNKTLKYFMSISSRRFNWSGLPKLILINAGADVSIHGEGDFSGVVFKNDIRLAKVLFEYYPDGISMNENGIDLCVSYKGNCVLWYRIRNNKDQSDIFDFYLKHRRISSWIIDRRFVFKE